MTDNPQIKIYVNKIENRTIFRVKKRYCVEILMPETMKLLASTKSKITKHENGENVRHLEINEVALVHCNTVNSDCQQDSKVLYTFVSNKLFGQLLDTSPKNLIFSKGFNSEFFYIKLWFTDQNYKLLEKVEYIMNITSLLIKV